MCDDHVILTTITIYETKNEKIAEASTESAAIVTVKNSI